MKHYMIRLLCLLLFFGAAALTYGSALVHAPPDSVMAIPATTTVAFGEPTKSGDVEIVIKRLPNDVGTTGFPLTFHVSMPASGTSKAAQMQAAVNDWLAGLGEEQEQIVSGQVGHTVTIGATNEPGAPRRIRVQKVKDGTGQETQITMHSQTAGVAFAGGGGGGAGGWLPRGEDSNVGSLPRHVFGIELFGAATGFGADGSPAFFSLTIEDADGIVTDSITPIQAGQSRQAVRSAILDSIVNGAQAWRDVQDRNIVTQGGVALFGVRRMDGEHYTLTFQMNDAGMDSAVHMLE